MFGDSYEIGKDYAITQRISLRRCGRLAVDSKKREQADEKITGQ